MMQVNSDGKYIHVIDQVANLANLIVAYEEVKAHPGFMTPAIDPKTVYGISCDQLSQIFRALLDGCYKFSRMRRIFVPKPRSKDKRPFTIPSPIDRIVHRSIATVLDDIFDPVFLPVYHGFVLRAELILYFGT
jgi:RNA-directed DNA polymerase